MQLLMERARGQKVICRLSGRMAVEGGNGTERSEMNRKEETDEENRFRAEGIIIIRRGANGNPMVWTRPVDEHNLANLISRNGCPSGEQALAASTFQSS